MATTPQSAEVEKRIQELNPEIRDIIFDVDIESIISWLTKKYQLHIDIAGGVMAKVYAYVTGALTSTDFIAELRSLLNDMPEEDFDEFLDEINTRIFQTIRDRIHEHIEEEQFFDTFEVDNTQQQATAEETEATDEHVQNISEDESEILKQSGVTVEDDTADQEETDTEDRDTLIEGIENPPKNTEGRWSESYVNKQKKQLKPEKRDYSVTKDPYREDVTDDDS